MKSSATKIQKFNSSKAFFAFVISTLIVVLFALVAFFGFQNAQANDSQEFTNNTNSSNFYLNLEVVTEGGGTGGNLSFPFLELHGHDEVIWAEGTTIIGQVNTGSMSAQVTSNAQANKGYTFVGWFWHNSGTKITEQHGGIPRGENTIEARFKINTYTVSFADDGNGSVIVKDPTKEIPEKQLDLPFNTQIVREKKIMKFYDGFETTKFLGSVQASPNKGYLFSKFNPEDLTVITQEETFTAVFVVGYLVDASIDKKYGTVESSPGEMPLEVFAETSFKLNDDSELEFSDGQKIRINVNDDYVLLKWTGYTSEIEPGHDYFLTQDTTFGAEFIYKHQVVNFSVAAGSRELGDVSESQIVVDYGTEYTLADNNMIFETPGTPKTVSAIPKVPSKYEFDYWEQNHHVVTEGGVVTSSITFYVHFKAIGYWRITGNVYCHGEGSELLPVYGALSLFSVYDEESSTYNVLDAATCIVDGYFSLYIPNDVSAGEITAVHSDWGAVSETIEGTPGTDINDVELILENDDQYVYIYGNIADNTEAHHPIVNCDVAFSYDNTDLGYITTTTNKDGNYYLKVDKTQCGGTIMALAADYQIQAKYFTKDDLQTFAINYYTYLSPGLDNEFLMRDFSITKAFKVDIWINEFHLIQGAEIGENLSIATNRDNTYISISGDTTTVTCEYQYDKTYQVKYQIKVIPEHHCTFTYWEYNGTKYVDMPSTKATRDGFLLAFGEKQCEISGLVYGNKQINDGAYGPLPNVEVFYVDQEYNVIAYTKTNTDPVFNYVLSGIPYKTAGYLIAFKDGYIPYIQEFSAEQISVSQITVDFELQTVEPGDDAYVYGFVSRTDEEQTPVAGATVVFVSEDGSVLVSTTSSLEGYYLLPLTYGDKGKIVSIADGYKPTILDLNVTEQFQNLDIKLDRNLENVEATFSLGENQSNYEIEVLSADGQTSYGKFEYVEEFTLQFEKGNQYILSDNKITFVYGSFMFRIIANPVNEFVFYNWTINPQPTQSGYLNVNTNFSANFVQYSTVDAHASSDYGTVKTSDGRPLPFKEMKHSFYTVNGNTIQFDSTNVLAVETTKGVFEGWYLNGNKLTDGTYELLDNIDLEANFSNKYFDVSFMVADGQGSMGKVEPSRTEALVHAAYNVNGNQIIINDFIASATPYDASLAIFDYWTVNGQKVPGQGYVDGPMIFVAHFKDVSQWHVSGKILSADDSLPVSDAFVFMYKDAETGIIDEVYSDSQGNYQLTIPYSVNTAVLFALHIDYGYQIETISKPVSGDITGHDIKLSLTVPVSLLYGSVSTQDSNQTPLEDIGVVFVYDDLSDYLHTVTSEDGNYVLEIDNTKGCGGTVYFVGRGYTMQSKHFTADELSNLIINWSVQLSESISNVVQFPDDGSCQDLIEDYTVDGFSLYTQLYRNDFSIGVPNYGGKITCDGNNLNVSYYTDSGAFINHEVMPEAASGHEFLYWQVDGQIIHEGEEIDVDKAVSITPVFQGMCYISGIVCELGSAGSQELEVLEGVSVTFYDQDHKVLASAVSTDANVTNWEFPPLQKGVSGQIVYIKEGYETQVQNITSGETQSRSMHIMCMMPKSESPSKSYVYGKVFDAASSESVISNAFVGFYNTKDGSISATLSSYYGTFLLSAEQGSEGYLVCMADGYRPSFVEFSFNDRLVIQDFALEKDVQDVYVDFDMADFQSTYEITVYSADGQEIYAQFDYPWPIQLSLQQGSEYQIYDDSVFIFYKDYLLQFRAVPVDKYDFDQWYISPTPGQPGILSEDTTFTPSFALQTGHVDLDIGTGVDSLNCKYYVNGELVLEEDQDYLCEDFYVDTQITVDEQGIIEARFSADYYQNETLELLAVITPQIEEGYEFDNLIINDEELLPGETLIVENEDYYGEINFKLSPQPDPPVPPQPDPDVPINPEYINADGSTGDNNLPVVAILFGVIMFAGICCLTTRKLD